jgi:probable phosphoglycerate mutase
MAKHFPRNRPTGRPSCRSTVAVAGHPEPVVRHDARVTVSGEPYERIFLARHGQTEWNTQNRRQGRLDSPLTDAGARQAERAASRLTPGSVDVVFSSPLGRARQTAELFRAQVEADLVVLDELAELDHGRFGGLTEDEIDVAFPGAFSDRANDKYNWRFPGGESYADVDVRAGAALRRIAETGTRAPLVVSHEMIGRMLLRNLLGLDPLIALARRHPHDVVYVVEPSSGVLREL